MTDLRRHVRPRTVLFVLCALWVLYAVRQLDSGDQQNHALENFDKGFGTPAKSVSRPQEKMRYKELVVASLSSDATSWLAEYLPDWKANVYVVDDPNASLTVPKNKGRESMVYLSYILDNYDDLPDYMVFMHSLRYQWHNDDPIYDGLPVLQNLQLPHVRAEGYANLRCAWVLGCPEEIKPVKSGEKKREGDSRVQTENEYEKAFLELFPNATVPDVIGVSCCAQFAVTREKIRERPQADYERYRQWILDTTLSDAISGRILEYGWHMIFGKPPVHCPNAQVCYCKTFGLCDLLCDEAGCEGRYTLAPYATIPRGWPEVGRGQDGWP